MSAVYRTPEKDLCPMCGGNGQHALKPPGPIYIRVRADIANGAKGYDRAEAKIEECARAGYELHSFAEDEGGTTWMMQWPQRWRTVL